MRPTRKFLLFALLASGIGCRATTPLPAPAAASQPTGRCPPRLEEVASAMNADRAIEATRGYLSCVATWNQVPPPDLERRVADALARNPYPQTQRRSRDILDRFFDEDRLRDIPETRAEMTSYLEVLEAQILRARAERNEAFAEAAEKRRKSLVVLGQVLDTVDPAP